MSTPKPEPVARVLIPIQIQGQNYKAERLPGPAVRIDGITDVYQVTRGVERDVCTCPDFYYRHGVTGDGQSTCKHVRAVLDENLFPPC